MSEMEKLLEKLGNEISLEIHGNWQPRVRANDALLALAVLRRKLLPLLEAGEALAGDVGCNSTKRQQLVDAHVAAKLAALKGDS